MKVVSCTCDPEIPATAEVCKVTVRFGKHTVGVDRYEDGSEAITLKGSLQDVRRERSAPEEPPAPLAPSGTSLCGRCAHEGVCSVAVSIRSIAPEGEILVSQCRLAVLYDTSPSPAPTGPAPGP